MTKIEKIAVGSHNSSEMMPFVGVWDVSQLFSHSETELTIECDKRNLPIWRMVCKHPIEYKHTHTCTHCYTRIIWDTQTNNRAWWHSINKTNNDTNKWDFFIRLSIDSWINKNGLHICLQLAKVWMTCLFIRQTFLLISTIFHFTIELMKQICDGNDVVTLYLIYMNLSTHTITKYLRIRHGFCCAHIPLWLHKINGQQLKQHAHTLTLPMSPSHSNSHS